MFRQAARPWLAATARSSRRPRDTLPSAHASLHYTPLTRGDSQLPTASKPKRPRNRLAVRNYARTFHTPTTGLTSDYDDEYEEFLEEVQKSLKGYREDEETLEAYEGEAEGLEEYGESDEALVRQEREQEQEQEVLYKEDAKPEAPDGSASAETAAWKQFQQNRSSYKTLRMS